MAIDERARHELHQRLDELLGPERAATLMAHLPPVGWTDVVTKHDLDARLDLTEQRILATLRAERRDQTRFLVFAMLGSNATLLALAFAAARFA
jgi:hypothetical protein